MIASIFYLTFKIGFILRRFVCVTHTISSLLKIDVKKEMDKLTSMDKCTLPVSFFKHIGTAINLILIISFLKETHQSKKLL